MFQAGREKIKLPLQFTSPFPFTSEENQAFPSPFPREENQVFLSFSFPFPLFPSLFPHLIFFPIPLPSLQPFLLPFPSCFPFLFPFPFPFSLFPFPFSLFPFPFTISHLIFFPYQLDTSPPPHQAPGEGDIQLYAPLVKSSNNQIFYLRLTLKLISIINIEEYKDGSQSRALSAALMASSASMEQWIFNGSSDNSFSMFFISLANETDFP